MKRIVFGFSRPKAWKAFAKLIMWADKSEISHGYTRFDSQGWGCSFIYQNSGHKTNFMGGILFDQINTRVEEYEIMVPEEIESMIGKICVGREGKPYALKQVIGKGVIFLIFLLSGGKWRLKNPFSDGDVTTDCIEEMSKILSSGFNIETPMDMDSVTVLPFRNFVASLPGVTKCL